MKIDQQLWTQKDGWQFRHQQQVGADAQLVLVFGSRTLLEDQQHYDTLRARYPHAHLLMASTSGEIIDEQVLDESMVVTAMAFSHTRVQVAQTRVAQQGSCVEVGKQLAQALDAPDLAYVLVISDGLLINGSDLVAGLHQGTLRAIPVTGGLAGDAARFEKTVVGVDAPPQSGNVVAVGFYGNHLRVGHGSRGGWDAFGPERVITRSRGNVLFELDGQSALDLYKTYLGEQAKGLPGTGLLFPLSIKTDDQAEPIVRTILAIDEVAKSMTFAGAMPEGATARLMKANFERLIDGASNAAEQCLPEIGSQTAEVAILISCVGRKLVLGQRIDDEVENVREVLGSAAVITGFYSYGEISPFTPSTRCELHNQTMTITTLAEI